ncbi:DNA-binding MarR family transcriptional regulator [Natranaerovirga hydrolytica]|uniref:DNA-binding MarR family transcriptional regulator n=1 Tax=Natranaerovirga hydrolytica TaxID=680378 RepID=A0A4R1MJY4_9FIRM|nr:MarR family transcriptional regulator [Natranaerovirga hydrolytica]TCK92837.1 DNA-binding MarR family transcriptional regulator [Natranaerovirga hydrolytica]
MTTEEILEKQKFIFGSLFFAANKLQTLGDSYVSKREMTMMQWLLTVAIIQFDNAPTLGEAANFLSSSHQNVKQIALKLEKKGFLKFEKDEKDKRILRLILTEKSNVFWNKYEDKDNEFIKELFKDFTEDEVNGMCNGMNKLFTRMSLMSELKNES